MRALTAIVLAVVCVLIAPGAARAADPGPPSDTAPGLAAGFVPLSVPGLSRAVSVRTDSFGVPHIFAANDRDAMFVFGYVHARDRFFQMDLLRRVFSGTAAELLGPAALEQDVQLRTLGLRRAAEASLPVQTAVNRVWLESYARGVNAWLGDLSHPLPPEYGPLEITRATVPPWTALDSLTIAKGLAFGLSFDLSDIDFTTALIAFQLTGSFAGFDGAALFFEDLYRTAPFDPTVAIPPGAPLRGGPPARRAEAPRPGGAPYLSPRALTLAAGYRERARQVPILARSLRPSWDERGSNWWIASGAITDSGYPVLANDPHLALDTPSTFYEAQVRIAGNGRPAMNAFGVTFPGVPGIVLGCNTRACWGATVNPLDVTDVYLEELVFDPFTGLPAGTIFDGGVEPVVLIPQTYLVNSPGDTIPDNLADAGIGPFGGGLTIVVPRRNNGPIIAVDASDPGEILALSVQYTGWGATRELDAFRAFHRAGSVEAFRDAIQFFDVGSQNFGYADVAGNIAYFTSAEMPLREDLQLSNQPDGGIPPWLIRDGTHQLKHEWLPVQNPQPRQSLPFEILPFAEMPQIVNPPAGYVINANNDPVGTSLDNNPLNQLRPGGGLYYLSPGYATGFRAGRIQRLFDEALAGDGMVTGDELRGFQANHQLLDAEVLVPYLTGAFANAVAPGADPNLAALAGDPGVAEAIGRLAAWDFSTPTGIQEGFDPGDDPQALPAPGAAEVDASIAATIYSAWRGQAVQAVIDGTLAGFGLQDFAPGSSVAMAALRNLLDTFPQNQGVGASGIDFFEVPGVGDREDARDVVLLTSLRGALDLLASDDFAPAFAHSTDQDDYRWGRLHRIVFDHPLGAPFSVPPAGGFDDLAPGLPGVARSGGFGAVDASSHSARADGVNEFMFGSGPSRRFFGTLAPDGPVPFEVIPGGESGVLGHPFYANQLPLWLTHGIHPFAYRPGDVVDQTAIFEVFMPQ